MQWLKQSTAITFQFGPFVDIGDGVTPETGLATNMDSATTGIRISKNGATMIDRNSATVPAHDDDGYYRIELSTTDTNTLGTLLVQYEEVATCLPMWREFMVVPANVWDSLFGADNLQVDVTQWLGTAAATPTVAGVPEVDVTHQGGGAIPAPAVTGVPDVNMTHHVDVLASITNNELDVNVGQIIGTAPSLTGGDIDVNVAAMAAGTVTATAVATDAIDADAVAADAIDLIWDEPLSGHSTGGTSGKALNNAASFIVTDGTCQATGQTSTNIRLAVGESATEDIYKNDLIVITGGTGAGESALITAYAQATKDCTVSPALVVTCDGTSTYEIVPAHTHAENLGADAVDAASVAAAALTTAKFGTDFLDATLIADNAFVAANFAASSLDGKGDWNIGKTGYSLSVAPALASVCTEARLAELDAANLPTTTDAIETDTQDIQARLPAALVGARMDSNMSAINNSNSAAVQLALSALEIESGACEGTPTTTVVQTDLAETQDDIYIGAIIIFTSGNARGERTEVTDYTGATGTLTVTALANAPAASDTFILL
jgi:hypothetical protein